MIGFGIENQPFLLISSVQNGRRKKAMWENRQFSPIFNQIANGLHFQVQFVVLIKNIYTFIGRLKSIFNDKINTIHSPLEPLLSKSVVESWPDFVLEQIREVSMTSIFLHAALTRVLELRSKIKSKNLCLDLQKLSGKRMIEAISTYSFLNLDLD